nr:protein IQ-DOMAIN 14-like [Ipomoea batatas]
MSVIIISDETSKNVTMVVALAAYGKARKALRALKGLVKLQAIVRGRIVRKQSADMLRRMQAMARIQAQACASRALVSDYSQSSDEASQTHRPVTHPQTPTQLCSRPSHFPFSILFGSLSVSRRGEAAMRLERNRGGEPARFVAVKRFGEALFMDEEKVWVDKHLGMSLHYCIVGFDNFPLDIARDRWMEEHAWNNYENSNLKDRGADDEKSDKIVEIDTWKPR